MPYLDYNETESNTPVKLPPCKRKRTTAKRKHVVAEGAWKPGMYFDCSWSKEKKRACDKARAKWNTVNPVKVKAMKLTVMRAKIARMESK